MPTKAPMVYIEHLIKYFNELDDGFKKISHLKEHGISNLPQYVFNKKIIELYKLGDLDYLFIKAYADKNLKENFAKQAIISSEDELLKHTYPMVFDFEFNNPKYNYTVLSTYANIREVDNINALPVLEYCIFGIIPSDQFFDLFSKEKAKERVIKEWNDFNKIIDTNYSFVYNLKKIFDKLELMLNDHDFTERKLHRYIKEHARYILPAHKNCYFEHALYLSGEKRVADFILEREEGLPPMLIELENAFQPVFKKNQESTQYTNHAKEQISEWVQYIEENSENAKNEMQFLTGTKEKLTIIGRGLNNDVKKQKYNNSMIWTYDILIKEAKDRWNKIIEDQCKTIGLKNINLL